MKTLLLKFLICIIFVGNVFAQDLRIGLVLSGGGAKGLSHIGIIKAFEEYQIPIYCITGASAGALVGGLYAAGMPIKKLEEIAMTDELNDIFYNKINPNEIPIEYRLNNLPEQVNLFVDEEKKKIIKPFGLFDDQSINDFISYWTIPGNCKANSNFDSLAVPFRCVGANIINKKSVVFSEGSLAKSMRASMAYPIAFEPVIIDSTILVDGGLYDNLPIEVAINIGANYIIAVNVGDIPPKPDEIQDVSSLANQLSNVLAARSDSEFVKNYDEFIQIDNSDISLFDFSTGDTTIKRGYEEGKVLAKKLAAIIDKKADIKSFHKKQNKYNNFFENRKRWEIIIKGNERFTKQQIAIMMALNKNKTFDYDRFHEAIQRLYSTGYFNSVDYDITDDKLNNRLIVTVDLKENKKIELHGGFYFDSNAGMNMYASIFNKRIQNTSLILKNYLFIGNYHNGIKSSISILNSYKVPMAKLRYSLSLSPFLHRYLYKGNIYGISN
ncbi:MAG: patatin-like phospholipase family protein, partial [Candidatus Marinimicrobia bacterium]|nr:patatin-like phospholipase family protein [Candidatus Neomarinimicrobiota bacterium]